MAFTVPERLPEEDDAATKGERKVFAALRQYLPEDYLVYYDIRVGDRYPDFTVIGPDLGVVVLEVKDWRLTSIASARADRVVIRQRDGNHELRSPVPQAREYTVKIALHEVEQGSGLKPSMRCETLRFPFTNVML